MKNYNHNITGILLAGGMSSRMGQEKGSMIIGKKMMYEYPLRALESVCDEILISGSSPLPGNSSHPVIEDEIKGIGPMGGIYTCLEKSRTDLNLVLSYDMPLINKGLLMHLAEKSGEWDMVVPGMSTDRPEPLCALYRRSMTTVLKELIREKNYAVHRVIPRVNSLVLEIEASMSFYNPQLFLNINYLEDLGSLPESFHHEA